MFNKIVSIIHIITKYATFVLFMCIIMWTNFGKKWTTFAEVTLKSRMDPSSRIPGRLTTVLYLRGLCYSTIQCDVAYVLVAVYIKPVVYLYIVCVFSWNLLPPVFVLVTVPSAAVVVRWLTFYLWLIDDWLTGFPSCRLILSILSFFGFFVVYCLRVNLSVALVAMVNATYIKELESSVADGNSTEDAGLVEELCEAASYNETQKDDVSWNFSGRSIIIING